MDELKTWFLQPALVRLAELAALFGVVWLLVRLLKTQVNRRAADSDTRYRGRKPLDVPGVVLVTIGASIHGGVLGC